MELKSQPTTLGAGWIRGLGAIVAGAVRLAAQAPVATAEKAAAERELH